MPDESETHLFAVSENSSIKKWRIHKPSLVETIPGFGCSLSNECFDICETLGIIVGLEKSNLYHLAIYSLKKKEKEIVLKEHTSIINCVLISKKRKLIFSGGDDNCVVIYSAQNFKLLFKLDKLHMSDIRSMKLNLNESFLLSAGHDKRFNLISLENPGMPIACGRIKERINKIVYIELSGEIICLSDEKQRFYVWNVDSIIGKNKCK
jgi:WD40 repeat protein